MQIDEQDLTSDIFDQLLEEIDDIFDNTLISDEVWVKEPAEGQMDTRYFMMSNEKDSQGNPTLIKPDAQSLY